MTRLRNGIFSLLCLCLLLALAPSVLAAEQEAENLSSWTLITDRTNFPRTGILFDGQLNPYAVMDGASVTFTHEGGLGSIYLIFDQPCQEYTLTCIDTGKTATLGTYGSLHEYADLVALFGSAPKSVSVTFHSITLISEVCLFGPGQVPDFVQKWEPPAEGEADLVLFSTHGDDEQLFFAGILPYYAGELGLKVQVVYMTSHPDSEVNRMHEMLNGLYAVGVRNYPVFGPFPDQLSDSLANGYSILKYGGYSKEMLLDFVVENLRRFKPLVAVTHDINGEYGHSQHMVYADLVMEAVQISAIPTQYPESAEQWGTWSTPKTYLHLYPENPIVMDWDQPLERFGGMTAFEVTRDLGFPCHVSQYYDFLWYLTQAKTAGEFWEYSPCDYGLFRTTVGPDVKKNDFFENLETYIRPKPLNHKQILLPLSGPGEALTVRP